MKSKDWGKIDLKESKIIERKIEFDPTNIKGFLQSQYKFRYNVITGVVELFKDGKFIRLDDRQFHSILQHVKDSGGKISENGLNSILQSNFVPSFHPFREFFYSLPDHDLENDPDYILQLSETVQTTNDAYWEKCLRKWMVAAVGCAINDNIENQVVLILKAIQGIGKSTWLLKLLPFQLDDYVYSGILNPTDKDTMSHLAECFLINLDELESLTKYKEAALKEIITKSSIRIRRPYSRFAENMTRHASFTGSVNHTNILHDSTGSRRFLIHEALDIDYQHDVDIDKAWAQAYKLFKEGFRFYFDADEIKEVNKENSSFEVASTEEELLLQHFEPIENPTSGDVKYTATEILKIIYDDKLPSNTRSASTTLGQALSKHGFNYVMIKGAKKYYASLKSPHENIFD